MKAKRQNRIIELIEKYEIETQEELADLLAEEGYPVTQATISRDIRELKLTKIGVEGKGQKYTRLPQDVNGLNERYLRVLQDGFISMDMAQNILVINTVSGMAMAVAAALDAMQIHEIVGCIAGDDTIMCAIRSADLTENVMRQIEQIIGKR